MSKPKVCLTMIVKNEEKVIERCLYSCLRLIDYFVICDTGSTDKTIEVINNFSKNYNLPGEVHQHEWKNFAHNRNLSLEIAKTKGDYIFWIDADDILEFEPNWKRPELLHDAYLVNIRYDPVHYKRIHLVKSTAKMSWVGVLHECLDVPDTPVHELYGLKMVIVGGGGGRNLDPKKHEKDAVILEKALIDEPNNHRYMFYLAQSYRNSGDFEKAIEWYEKRSTFEHFPEERCYSKYQVGVLKLVKWEKEKKYTESEILFDLLQSYEYYPLRVEPLFAAMIILNRRKMYNVSYNLGVKALCQRRPDEACILFTEQEVFNYKLPFEVAYSAFNSGKLIESLSIYMYLMLFGNLDQEQKNKVQVNLQVCMNKLGMTNLNLSKKELVNFVSKTQEPSLKEMLFFIDK